mgnify:CR=1 FL=1
MSYTLNSVIINPSSKSSPKNAVILCHGYGGDGNDYIFGGDGAGLFSTSIAGWLSGEKGSKYTTKEIVK